MLRPIEWAKIGLLHFFNRYKIPDDLIESDFVIEKTSDYYKGTGLTVDSVIRLHKMVTIPISLIKRKLGVMNINTEQIVSEKIKNLFEN